MKRAGLARRLIPRLSARQGATAVEYAILLPALVVVLVAFIALFFFAAWRRLRTS